MIRADQNIYIKHGVISDWRRMERSHPLFSLLIYTLPKKSLAECSFPFSPAAERSFPASLRVQENAWAPWWRTWVAWHPQHIF